LREHRFPDAHAFQEKLILAAERTDAKLGPSEPDQYEFIPREQ